MRILRHTYSSSRKPYARRWMTRILMLSPSTKPSESLFSGWQTRISKGTSLTTFNKMGEIFSGFIHDSTYNQI